MNSSTGDKKTRRPRGQAKPFPIKRDGKVVRWGLVVELPPDPDRPDKRNRRWVYGPTPRAAEANRDELEKAIARGEVDRREGPPPTLEAHLSKWLEETVKVARGARTYENYRILAHKHIIPTLGHVRIDRLKPRHIQALYAEKTEAGYSASTVYRLAVILRSSLAQAVAWKDITENPALQTSPPAVKSEAPAVLTAEQSKHLLIVARGHRLEALFLLALHGLREGELLGLRWQDIDWSGQALRLVQTVGQVEGKLVFDLPKGTDGRRQVPVTAAAIAAMERRRAVQAAEREAAGERWQEKDLVFTTRIGTAISPSNLRNREFARLLERAGLAKRRAKGEKRTGPRLTPHSLRHSTATSLMERGWDSKIVAALLGHANEATTRRVYQHVRRSIAEAAVADLGKLLDTGEPDS